MSFYLSKILWVIFNPFNLFIFFIFFSSFLSFFLKNFYYKFIVIFNIFFFLIIAVLPTGEYMIYKLEKRFHSDFIPLTSIDGVLILSGATEPFLTKEYNQIHLNGAIERLTESIGLIKKFPNAKIIFSGGSGSLYHQELKHADVAKKFFLQQNIKIDNIIFENKSKNTYENILFSKKIAEPKLNDNWILITSAFHMTRAINIAENLEWKVIPYPVDFNVPKKISWKPKFNFLNNINLLQLASHEWLGLVSYYIMGRTNKIY